MKKMLTLALIVIVLLVIGCSGSTEPEDNETGSNAPTNLVANYNWNVSDEVICSVDLIWVAPEEPDNDNFEYRIYKNDQFLTTLTNMQNYYTDIDCIPGGEYDYFITSYYSSGESEPSNVVNILINMIEILTDGDGRWFYNPGPGWIEYLSFYSNGSFEYGWGEWSITTIYSGSFSVDHSQLTCTYTDSTQTQQTLNDYVTFGTYTSMSYAGDFWEN